MLWIIIGITGSYFIGSLPTAYIFGRVLKGIDIRKFGSGNVGATNAVRVLGKRIGLVVLLIDILKGVLPVVFIGDYILSKGINISPEAARILLGLGCIFGHNWTVFLRFKGGKGVACTFGVLIGLAIRIGGIKIVLGLTILTWLIIFSITRIVSLASVVSVMVLPAYMVLFKESKILIISSLMLSIFIILRHRANLKRFFQGKEPRMTFKKPR